MKNPFKKADSAKLPEQGRERTEIDYAHRTIIHHMLYGYPGDFSSCASLAASSVSSSRRTRS